MTTVGAIRRSPRDAACGCASSSDERGLVVGPEERLGVTDPDGPVGAGGVVDEVRQRLGDRGPRDVGHERVQLGRGPADVERATYGLGGEPVDGRPTPRLHLGRELQPAGQVRLERAGGDGGQVRLEQHVVHRLREQRREEGRGVVAGEQGPGVRRHAAQRDQAQGRRLAQGPRHLVATGARTAGTQPGQPRDERGRPGAGRQHVPVRRSPRSPRARTGGCRPRTRWCSRGRGRSAPCPRRRGCRPGRAGDWCPTRRAPPATSARPSAGGSRRRSRRSGRRPRCRPRRSGSRAAGPRPRPPRAAPRWPRRRAGGRRRP